jgi:hypothetical protein
MTTQEYDTDPSTPGAKRLSDPRSAAVESLEDPQGSGPEDVGAVSPRARPTTDPGIAPPAEPLPVTGEPMGIVVPPVVRTSNDSVDVLLEGIRREQSGRGGTAQTDGHKAAAYHGEHRLHAAHAAARVEPSVLVERPILEQTVRIRMSGSKVWLPDADARDATQPTAVGTRSMMLRMALAVCAGVVVVVALFAAFQRWSRQVTPAAPTAQTSEPVSTQGPDPTSASLPKSASQAMPLVPVDSSTTKRAVEAEPTPAAAVVSSTVRRPASSAKPNKPKAKPAAPAAKPTSDDLGEFKSAF